jgi:hypothetical protein
MDPGQPRAEKPGLLQIKKQPHGRDFDFRRMRNTYWIDKAMLSAPTTRRHAPTADLANHRPATPCQPGLSPAITRTVARDPPLGAASWP